MESFLLVLHIVVSILLILVVLLQSGKSADLAGAFGGGGSQSTFGPRGAATILSKITTGLAVLFMVNTLLLMIISRQNSASDTVMAGEKAPIVQKADEKKPAVTEEKAKEEKPAETKAADTEKKAEDKKETVKDNNNKAA